MGKFSAEKVVSALPATLTPDTVYAVRTGDGFDLYISDTTGNVAHKINTSQVLTANVLGTLRVSTALSRWYPAAAVAFTALDASVGTAPTGADLLFEIKKNGVAAVSGSIAAGEYKSTMAISLAATAADYLTVSVTQVGAADAGSDLVLRLR